MKSIHLPVMTLDGTSTPLEIDPDEIERYYLPLARFLHNHLPGGARSLVGIAGPPACGKTAFCQLLSAVINALQGDEEARLSPLAVHVGLDGWHYPNAYLDTHTILRDGVDIPLRKVKGSPASFDTSGLLAFLRAVRQGQNPTYPLYSRVLHDPQPGGQILASHRLVLVEGNYFLLDLPPWRIFRELFSLTIFLTAPREILIAAMAERHRRGGRKPSDIQDHMAFSDIPNLDLVLTRSYPADIEIQKSDSRHISAIIYT